MPDQTVWLAGTRPAQPPRMRLFCFPPAGGGASIYQPWVGAMPTGVELCRIQLPGRESRFGEPAVDNLDTLLPPLEEALLPLLDVPFAFFGHSMGALVSFELTRRLRDAGKPQPLALFPSAHRAPHLPLRRRLWAKLPREELITELDNIDGIPEELRGNDEILDVVLPTVRIDLELYEGYRHQTGDPLACRITAFGGDNDSLVEPEEVEAWSQHTSGPCTVHIVQGTHFFLHQEAANVGSTVAAALAELMEAAG